MSNVFIYRIFNNNIFVFNDGIVFHTYGGPQLPRQERKAHGKRKKATARERRPRQERKAHGKREKLTARERRPRQEKEVHGKRKKATAKPKRAVV